MKEEMLCMKINYVWSLEKIPENSKRIDSKWVYKKKIDSSGKVKYKA